MKTKTPPTTIIIEKLWESLLKDFFSVFSYGVLFWVNLHYLGNTFLIKLMFVIVGLTYSFKYAFKRVKRFDTKADAGVFLLDGVRINITDKSGINGTFVFKKQNVKVTHDKN